MAQWLAEGRRAALHGRAAAPVLRLFVHELELPFPPYPGLRISAADWECEPLERVEWAAAEGLFKCAVADEYPHCAGNRVVDEQDLVRRALGNGWQPARRERHDGED